MQSGTGFLSRVEPRASCVLNASVDAVWAVVRDWGSFLWLPEVDGRPLRSSVLEGRSNMCVGAIRMVDIGAQRMFERLIAVDDEEHCIKWQVISHPETINPFPASLVNYACTLKVMPITVGNNTYIDWQGVLFTEVQHSMTMKATLERWYLTGFQCLQECVGQRSHTSTQKQYAPQVGSIQGSPFVMGMSGSTVGVPAGAKCTSPPKATSGGLAQTSSARSAPAALLRSLSIGRSLEGIVGGLELHTPQRASRHRTKQQEETLGMGQSIGRNKNISIDSDVLMGRSISWGGAGQVRSSSLQSVERGSLPGSIAEQLPGSGSNSSGTADLDGPAAPWVSNTLDGDTLNSLIAGGRSGTLSRAELRTQLDGLCGGPVTREEIQLLEMLRDAKAAPAGGTGGWVSPAQSELPMARTASDETAVTASSGGSCRSSQELPKQLEGFKSMHLEAHPIQGP